MYVLGCTLNQVHGDILISTFFSLSWEMAFHNRNGQESFLCVLWESELGRKEFHKHHSSLMTIVVGSGSHLTARTSGAQTLEIYFKIEVRKYWLFIFVRRSLLLDSNRFSSQTCIESQVKKSLSLICLDRYDLLINFRYFVLLLCENFVFWHLLSEQNIFKNQRLGNNLSCGFYYWYIISKL